MRLAVVAVIAIVLVGARTASADLRKGPYVQDLTSTGVTVMWEVEPAAAGRVIVDGPGLPADGAAIDVPVQAIGKAVIGGLRPATRYRYRVEVGDARAAGEVATAPEVGAPAPLSFAVFGDNGTRASVHRRIVELVIADVPDLIVSTGDLVADAGDPTLWQQLFDVERALLRDTVLLPTLGNHDARSDGEQVHTFRELFSLPGGAGATADAPLYYGFSYGRSRFVVLDSNARGAELDAETAWLARELAAARSDARVDHVFAVMHHPVFSISHHGGNRYIRPRWAPLFERYAVTAVFAGHDHVYERAKSGGVHYFVSGGGGASPYRRDPDPAAVDAAAVRRLESVNHYLRVTVDGERIEVTAIRRNGTVIETTAWTEPVRPRPVATAAVADPAAALAGATVGAEPEPARAPASIARVAPADADAAPRGYGRQALVAAAGALLAVMLALRALRRDGAP